MMSSFIAFKRWLVQFEDNSITPTNHQYPTIHDPQQLEENKEVVEEEEDDEKGNDDKKKKKEKRQRRGRRRKRRNTLLNILAMLEA